MIPEEIIAVDGGQSGIRARLTTTAGVSEGTGAGFTYRTENPPRALGLAAASAILATGWTPQGTPLAVAAGLSGLPLGPERDLVAAEIAPVIGEGTLYLCGDHITAHAGAFPVGPGVVLSLGTGTVAVGVTEHGVRVCDGWGFLIDDAGSASWFGRAALRAAARHGDGRIDAPVLSALLHDLLGDVAAAARAVHESGRPSRDLARLAPVVFQAAGAGEAEAQRIILCGANELAATIAAAAGGPGASAPGRARPVSVAVIGGLTKAGAALREPLESALARVLPSAQLIAAAGDCTDGAERIARYGPIRYAEFISEYRIGGGRATVVRREERER